MLAKYCLLRTIQCEFVGIISGMVQGFTDQNSISVIHRDSGLKKILSMQ